MLPTPKTVISEKQKEFNPRNFRTKKTTTISGTHTHSQAYTYYGEPLSKTNLTTVQGELQPGKGREWAGLKKAFEILHLPYNSQCLTPSPLAEPSGSIFSSWWKLDWLRAYKHSFLHPSNPGTMDYNQRRLPLPQAVKNNCLELTANFESEVTGTLLGFTSITFLKFHGTGTNQSLIFIPPSIIITGE